MAGLDQKAMADGAIAGAIRAGESTRPIGIQPIAYLRYTLSPGFWLATLALLCLILLLLPVKLAIGGYYWDVYLYPDAAWRIANGQIPSVDFFIPAGALEYYAYALLSAIFPQGQQVLMAQWGLLLVSLPLMAWTMRDLPRENPFLSLAIVLPFIFFSFVPLNTKEVYPLAGVDGYGVYNRHSCLLLYIMVTAFIFVPAGRKLSLLTGLIFTALFFTKITGAITALLIIAQAVLCGRLDRRALGLSAGFFVAICLLIELPSGMVSAYFRDVLTLVGMNAGGLIERLRSPIVMYLDILAPLIILSGLLLWVDRSKLAFLMSQTAGLQFRTRLARLSGHESVWILIIVAAGILFETQNTGSLAFIFVWPFLAHLFSRWHPKHRDRRTAVLLLIALSTLPMLMPMLHRTARVTAASIFYDQLNEPALGPYSNIEAKPELIERAYAMKDFFGRAEPQFRQLSEAGHQSSYLLYSEIDYQLAWLTGVSDAAAALLKWESVSNKRLASLITLDFVDVFTPLLKRSPVRLVSIGMAAERTVPPLDDHRLAEAMKVEGLLVPLCPVTPVRLSLMKTFAPVLQGRQRVHLSPCWDLYVKG